MEGMVVLLLAQLSQIIAVTLQEILQSAIDVGIRLKVSLKHAMMEELQQEMAAQLHVRSNLTQFAHLITLQFAGDAEMEKLTTLRRVMTETIQTQMDVLQHA